MKSVNDRILAIACIVFILVLFVVRCEAQQYEYKGVYTVQSVMLNYCDDCYLELPPDYLKAEIVLSVSTDTEQQLFKALQSSSRAVGWELVKLRNGTLRAEPNVNSGNMIFISCMDMQPRNVPKYLYSASVKADKMQCEQRDSLLSVARERAFVDSVRRDSISRQRLDFKGYRLKYFAYSKSFSDRYGVEWSQLLASGNMRGKLKLFDDWRIVASETNDTTFTARMVEFSVDSSLSLDWGSEEQTLKQTYINDGVTTQDYEWRKYGLLINVRRDGQRVRMDYVFRDKDNSVSVLQGSVIGLEGDTLRLVGDYSVTRNVSSGVPFISSVPVLGNLFKVENTIVDNRAFELYLLPQEKAVKDDKREDKGIIPTDRKNGSEELRKSN